MEWVTSEILQVLMLLLPGFISAWIFYSLTSYPKPSEFERVVQALIFTVLIQGLVVPTKYLLYMTGGSLVSFGPWTKDATLVTSLIIATIIGILFSAFANNDRFHTLLRALKITKETSYESEWFGAFSETPTTYIVLHLKGERRLYGWPQEWPSDPRFGHFSIVQAEWLDGEDRIDLQNVKNILVPAKEVEFVEFMK